jgi:hypothetical protein
MLTVSVCPANYVCLLDGRKDIEVHVWKKGDAHRLRQDSHVFLSMARQYHKAGVVDHVIVNLWQGSFANVHSARRTLQFFTVFTRTTEFSRPGVGQGCWRANAGGEGGGAGLVAAVAGRADEAQQRRVWRIAGGSERARAATPPPLPPLLPAVRTGNPALHATQEPRPCPQAPRGPSALSALPRSACSADSRGPCART